jgi:hypothetical protein
VKVTFAVRPTVPKGKSVIDVPIPRATLGEGLDAIDKSVPIDAIADCFFTTRMPAIVHSDRPIGDAMAQLSYATNHKWWKQDGCIMFQSMSFDTDRRLEPPSGAVARWNQRALSDGLDLDDYAEMAALNDGVLGTLLNMVATGDFPDALQPVNQARDHLKLWNALNRTQRRKAQADGLPYKDMSHDEQLLMAQAAMEPESRIATAKFRVEMRQNKLWGIKTPGGSSLSGVGSREEALSQFQRSDPGVKLQDVKQAVFTNARFIYETSEFMIYQSYAQMPPLWLEVKGDTQN